MFYNYKWLLNNSLEHYGTLRMKYEFFLKKKCTLALLILQRDIGQVKKKNQRKEKKMTRVPKIQVPTS